MNITLHWVQSNCLGDLTDDFHCGQDHGPFWVKIKMTAAEGQIVGGAIGDTMHYKFLFFLIVLTDFIS